MRRPAILLALVAALGTSSLASAAQHTTVKRTDAWPLQHKTTIAASSRGPRVAELQYLVRNPRPKQNPWSKIKGTLKPGTYSKGIYDHATAAAAVAYKYRLGYPARGQCGSKVDEWRQTKVTAWFMHLLNTGQGRPYCWVAVAAKRIAAIEQGATPVALKIKNVELSQVGVYGSARYADYFHVPRSWQWCAVFQNWGRAQVGLQKFADSNPWYVPSIISWGGAHGYLNAKAKVGEWVLYYGDISHIGYVVKVEANGFYWTVEGNYANHVAEVHHSPYDHLHYFLALPGIA